MVRYLPAALPAASALPMPGLAALMVADRVGLALTAVARPGFALTAPHFLLLRLYRPGTWLTPVRRHR